MNVILKRLKKNIIALSVSSRRMLSNEVDAVTVVIDDVQARELGNSLMRMSEDKREQTVKFSLNMVDGLDELIKAKTDPKAALDPRKKKEEEK